MYIIALTSHQAFQGHLPSSIGTGRLFTLVWETIPNSGRFFVFAHIFQPFTFFQLPKLGFVQGNLNIMPSTGDHCCVSTTCTAEAGNDLAKHSCCCIVMSAIHLFQFLCTDEPNRQYLYASWIIMLDLLKKYDRIAYEYVPSKMETAALKGCRARRPRADLCTPPAKWRGGICPFTSRTWSFRGCLLHLTASQTHGVMFYKSQDWQQPFPARSLPQPFLQLWIRGVFTSADLWLQFDASVIKCWPCLGLVSWRMEVQAGFSPRIR